MVRKRGTPLAFRLTFRLVGGDSGFVHRSGVCARGGHGAAAAAMVRVAHGVCLGPAAVDVYGLVAVGRYPDRAQPERHGAVRCHVVPDLGPVAVGFGDLLFGAVGRQRRDAGEGPANARAAIVDEPLQQRAGVGQAAGQHVERVGPVGRVAAAVHAFGPVRRRLVRADWPRVCGDAGRGTGGRQHRLDPGPVAREDVSNARVDGAGARLLAGCRRGVGPRRAGGRVVWHFDRSVRQRR